MHNGYSVRWKIGHQFIRLYSHFIAGTLPRQKEPEDICAPIGKQPSMTFTREKLNDRWLRILCIPSVALVANVLFFSGKGQQVNHSFSTQLLHSVIHSLVIWELARLIILW